MWWLFIAQNTIYLYFFVTHILKYRENDWRKKEENMVVIHSRIHDLLVLLCNSLPKVKRERLEKEKDMVVIHSAIHNVLVLLYNSLSEVQRD